MFRLIGVIFICLLFSGCSLSQILVDTDGDGVLNHRDICKDTPKGSLVDEFGCAIDSDKDGVIDLYDRCPNTPLIDIVNDKGCSVK